MTVLEVIQRSTDYLAQRGIESPRLQTELILAQVLALARLKLYLEFERKLSESELSRAREMVRRRGQHEPLQHILGSTSFCGLEIAVDKRVLIPRPETEVLAEHAWTLLQRVAPPGRTARVVDLCAGTGCIAIAIAAHHPTAIVHACDLSAPALDLARQNAARHRFEDRITFFEGDLFAALPAGHRYDMVVSNPPYIPSAEISSLQPEVRDYDPRSALDGGKDGLDIIRRIALEARAIVAAGGHLLLEFGDGQAAGVQAVFSTPSWTESRIEKDFSGRERILIARRANP